MKICVGKVVRTKGLKGELIIYYFTHKLLCETGELVFFENIVDESVSGPFKVEKMVYYKTVNEQKFYILKLAEINFIDEAKKFKSCHLIKECNKLPENVYLKSDIIDADVILKDENKLIGKVINLLYVKPYYKILLVKTSEEEIFIPFIKEVIHKVDVQQKQIIVNKIDGITDNL